MHTYHVSFACEVEADNLQQAIEGFLERIRTEGVETLLDVDGHYVLVGPNDKIRSAT